MFTDLEAKHSQLGLYRAGVESKFYSEGALGELNPTLKTVLDILKTAEYVQGTVPTYTITYSPRFGEL